jgi:hydrogenase nickel incorporation protein HypA/HybF
MHELSVAAGILDVVRQYVPMSQAPLVRTVRLRVGEMAGVLPESLDFCFGAIVAGTPYALASLEIERVPARGTCGACGACVEASPPESCCSVCGSFGITLSSGEELQVVDVEIEDGAEVTS